MQAIGVKKELTQILLEINFIHFFPKGIKKGDFQWDFPLFLFLPGNEK